MSKAFLIALAMANVQALTSEDLKVDTDASTSKVGIVPWQPFYDAYIDGLFAGGDYTPTNYDQNDHLCFWKIIIEQPFVSGVSDRYSYGIVHNCPAEIVTGITFNLTVQTGTDTIIYDDKASAAGVTVENSTISVTLTAKTEAGEGTGNDFGIWTTLDTVPSLSYSYIVNLAGSVDEPAQQPEEPVVLPDGAELFVDPTKTEKDLDLNGDPTTHFGNFRNAFASSGLDEYTVEYGEYMIDEELVKNAEYAVTLQIINKHIPSGEDAASGCRRFGFSAYPQPTSFTPVLGKNCSGDFFEGDMGSSSFGLSTHFTYFEGLKRYPDDHLVSYLVAVGGGFSPQGHDFMSQYGLNAEERSGKTLWETKSALATTNERICGLKYQVQTFKEVGKSHYTNYVNWRMQFCAL